MIIRRSIFAFALSAIIAGGTWFTVTKNTNDTQRTLEHVNRSAEEYQQQTQEALKDVAEGTRSAEEVAQETTEAGKKVADDAIEALQADGNVPDEVKEQLEAAQKEF